MSNNRSWSFERPISALVEQLQFARSRGRYGALLVGAGCSASAGIPTASGFVHIIRERFPTEYDAANPKTYASCMARLTDAVQQDLIGESVDAAMLNPANTGMATLVRSGYIDRVLTTNFDHLIMRACVELNVWPSVYDYAASSIFLEERIHGPAIIHLQGKHDGFVLINTPEAFQSHRSKIDPVIKESEKRRIWIVVGYSGDNDPVFDRLCTTTKFPFGLFWVYHGDSDPAPHVVERLLGESRNAYLIRGYDADSFFTSLTRELGIGPGEESHLSDLRESGVQDRLSKLLIDHGADSLDNEEILEYLLSYAIEAEYVKSSAKLLLSEFGSLGGVLGADPRRLLDTLAAIGSSAAKDPHRFSRLTTGLLKAVKACAGRILIERIEDKPVIGSWTALIDYLRVVLGHEPVEQFRVLFLDRKNVLIKDELQQRGTVDHTPLYPREITRRALELQASAIILVHNHPTGDPTPSPVDIEITKQVLQALGAVGITLHDHVIVGKNRQTSFKSQRLI